MKVPVGVGTSDTHPHYSPARVTAWWSGGRLPQSVVNNASTDLQRGKRSAASAISFCTARWVAAGDLTLVWRVN